MPAADESSKVIELSVEETNKLRASLGLAPLRVTTTTTEPAITENKPSVGNNVSGRNGDTGDDSKEEKVLELSVDESNALREKLGLAPLRTAADSTGSSKPVVHAPARNLADDKVAVERIEQAKLKREVQAGITKFAASQTLGEQATSTAASSWAAQMRQQQPQQTQPKQSQQQQRSDSSSSKDKQPKQKRYDQDDLQGMQVAHAVSELQEGSTTVLTLADAPLLATADADGTSSHSKAIGLNEEQVQLENVQLAQDRKLQTGLAEKRKLELGLGRAGGYAGYDDDEFEELGGTQGPSRRARGLATSGAGGESGGAAATTDKRLVRGFQIGAHLQEQEEQLQSDLFAGLKGQTVSLHSQQTDTAAADFMTAEEDEALRQKKKTKFKKKKKKSKKDKKKKSRRKRNESDDDEEEEEEQPATTTAGTLLGSDDARMQTKGLADELEATATVNNTGAPSTRKRRREVDGSDDDEQEPSKKGGSFDPTSASIRKGGGLDISSQRRAKYDSIMSKGNERTRNAFAKVGAGVKKASGDDDEEPDDAFLNAALAKARRLNRLKAMSSSSSTAAASAAAPTLPSRRDAADAVVEAVKSAQLQAANNSTAGNSGGTVEFSVDETREFTRALRARTEQTKRSEAKKKDVDDNDQKAVVMVKEEEKDTAAAAAAKDEQDDVPMEDVDLHELAKEVKEDDPGESMVAGLDGTTGATVSIGRGVGSVLGLLMQTGEMTRKNAGKEEMRGRAKDKKTYEDYESPDLSEVVRIDERTATAQDRDLASREIKLEYRDKHGRLLTRKQAFRELSYQFHGYGSGKRKEEKRLQQIAREQAEARLASRQAAEGAGAGTFGALKATQKATGKAFVVHKTQN